MTTTAAASAAIDLSTVLLKILGPEGQSIHGGSCTWALPKGKRGGKWMPPVEGEIRACGTGYHLAKLAGLHECTAKGCLVFLAEGRGDQQAHENKVAFREARLIRRLSWDDRIARLFAADCAERVLPIYERDYPTDKRPRMSIEVARRFAEGQATPEELAAARAAARDAARDAAWAAARAAAWDAETTWQERRLAWYLGLLTEEPPIAVSDIVRRSSHEHP